MSKSLLPILRYPHNMLRQVATVVEVFDSELSQLAANMVFTMRHAQGIGLAAPQVGRSIRLITVDKLPGCPSLWTGLHQVLVNPEITGSSSYALSSEEKCLSFPKGSADIARPPVIKIKYQDLLGHVEEVEVCDLASRCIQHEVDHLNGITLAHYMSPSKRKRLYGVAYD